MVSAADIKNGSDVVKAMHERYSSKWYKTLTFVQKTITHKPDGTDDVATWYEAMSLPGRLRIDIAPLEKGNGMLFTDGKIFQFRDGKTGTGRPLVHPLMVLGFDVYMQPVGTTVDQLKGLGINLSLSHQTKWQGRDVYVVGAENSDLTKPQFWIDKENLYFVRLIQLVGPERKVVTETQFNKYEKVKGGGWIAPEVLFFSDGRKTMTEEYSDIQTDVALDRDLWDSQKWMIVDRTYFKLGSATVPKRAAAANSHDIKKQIQLELDEWHKAGKFPGATVGVTLASGESFGLAVGFSDRETKVPMKPTDRMLAGSTGKTFAAAVALQLVKEGKIVLDDKVEKYLGSEPWFSRLPNAKDITVRQLMNHTSGLVRYEFKDTFTTFLMQNPMKVWTPAERLAYLLDEKPPFVAGKGWDYSDTNYIVLGMIIEKVTGKEFYDEARRRLIKPLKLTDTIAQEGPVMKGVVQGYAGAENPFGKNDAMMANGKFLVNPQLEWTGGGWASTSEDLARWAKMIYEGKAFHSSLLPQVLDGVDAPMLGRTTKYGLCAIIRPTPAGITYGHSGFFPGYMTDMMYFPETKVAIAVQVNTSVGRDLGGKGPGRIIIEIAELIKGAPKAD
ncbi:MAG: serine hydrolase [Pyrinomonadaceae bacterium]